MKHFFYLVSILLLTTACLHKEEISPIKEEGNTTLYFNYSLPLPPATKVLSVNDSIISNCNILIYNEDGVLFYNKYSSNGVINSINVSLNKSALYKIYFVANIGDLSSNKAILSENSLNQFRYSIEDYSELINAERAIPMSYCTGAISLSDNNSITLAPRRTVSLISITIDKSQFTGDNNLTITSAKLKNVAKSIALFEDSKVESFDDVIEGDFANEGDLEVLNNGGSVEYYLFENNQGELLVGNTDPSEKFFPEESIYNNLCTYFEIEATYNNTTHYGTNTYRFYLGRNTTSNFDVERNLRYNITIVPTVAGLSEDSWRVDVGELGEYVTTINIEGGQNRIKMSDTLVLSASILPITAKDTSVTWNTSDPNIAIIDPVTGILLPVNLGSCIVTASANDGSGISDSLQLRVSGPLQRIVLIPSKKDLKYDEVFNVRVVADYGEGDSEILDPSLCNFSIQYPNTCNYLGEGVFQGAVYNDTQRTTEIRVEYGGFTSKYAVTLRASYTTSRALPYQPYLNVGDTIHMTCKEMYNNGYSYEHTMRGTDLTPGFAGSGCWFSEDTSIASCTQDGEVVALQSGNTYIEGRYYYSDGKYADYRTKITVR